MNTEEQQWVELERMIGYIMVNKDNIKITYRKPKELRPAGMLDSNHATNKDDRRSISGALFMVGGVLKYWYSKTQLMVTLSCMEVEYVLIVTGVHQILFANMLLKEIMPKYSRKPGMILKHN